MDILKTLESLLSLDSESELVEFKEAKNDFDFNKLGKYFSALANEANLSRSACAWLVFGIKDDQSVVGTKFKDTGVSLQKLKADVANHTTHRITFIEIYACEYQDKRVVLFKIPPARISGVRVTDSGNIKI